MARLFDLSETKRGTFVVSGVVTGTESDRFYKEKITKTNQNFRMINFGLQYENQKTIYMSMNGLQTDKVYFSKKDVNGNTITTDVPWARRFTGPDGDGWQLIGVRLGLIQKEDEKGKTKNELCTMPNYDACEYVRDNLVDGMSVYVQGNIENSTYHDGNNNVMHSTKYVPSRIFLCHNDFDLDNLDELENDKKPKHSFTQTIIFMGIEKEVVDNKDTGRFIVSAKVVTYSSVEDVEYVIADKSLANIFRKNLKPYASIEVWGRIEVFHNIEVESSDDDCWGQANEMKVVSAPSKIELIITGALPSSIDTNTYNEENIAEAIRKVNAGKQAEAKFADNNQGLDTSWGEDNEDDDDGEEDW